jgi:hypothetical protein
MENSEFKIGVIKPIECLKEAWQLIKQDYWLLFAITLVGILIGGFTGYILLGGMICGISLCYLQVIDGGKTSFDNLFKGINYFLPGLLVAALFIIPMILVFAVIYAPLLIAAVMGSKLSNDELMGLILGSLAIDTVIAIIMVCLHTLLMFSFPLIADRKLSGWAAIKLSAKAVWKNLGGVAGIWALMFVVNLMGLLVFFVGIYLTIPIVLATQLVAYRKVFPKFNSPEGFNQPPMPNSYTI